MFSIGQDLKRLHKIMCKPSCTSSSRASVKNRKIYKIEGAFGAPALERENALARKQLLYYGARSGEHSQAAIVEFLVLHLPERLWILGLQAEWVPKGANTEKFFFAIIVGQRSSKFMRCGHEPKCGPEVRSCRRREVRRTCGDKFTITPSIEEGVIKIRHDYTQGCLHANAAVLDLCATVGGDVTIFGESCRVPEAQWLGDASHVFRIES